MLGKIIFPLGYVYLYISAWGGEMEMWAAVE